MDTSTNTTPKPVGAGAIGAALDSAVEQALSEAEAAAPAGTGTETETETEAQPASGDNPGPAAPADPEKERARQRIEELRRFKAMRREEEEDFEPEPEPEPESEPESEPEPEQDDDGDDGVFDGDDPLTSDLPPGTRADIGKYSKEGKIRKEDRLAKVGIIFRRRPEEVDKTFLSAEIPRYAIILAYVGPDGAGEEPLAWAGSVMRFYPPQWDEKKGLYVAGFRTVEAYRCHCRACRNGKGLTYTVDAKTAITYAEKLVGFRMRPGMRAVHAMVALGDICPNCKERGMDEWHQFDVMRDSEAIFGAKEFQSFKSEILDAKGNLNIPPVVGYIDNGEPGSLSDLPDNKDLVKILDESAATAAKKGIQILDLGSIGVREIEYDNGQKVTLEDNVKGFDLVMPQGHLTGTEVAGRLDRGFDNKKSELDAFQYEIKIPLWCAWNRTPKFLPSIDKWEKDDYDGKIKSARRPHHGKTRFREERFHM